MAEGRVGHEGCADVVGHHHDGGSRAVAGHVTFGGHFAV